MERITFLRGSGMIRHRDEDSLSPTGRSSAWPTSEGALELSSMKDSGTALFVVIWQ